jgi:hypothetical protein
MPSIARTLDMLVRACVLVIAVTAAASAQGIDGTWQLIKRQLPDGTVLTPPAVVGVHTVFNGMRHLNVFWHTPDGKPASIGVVSRVKLDGDSLAETMLAFTLDDGSGKPALYDFSGGTRTVPVSRSGGRIAFKMPFDPPSVVYEGDRAVATLEGEFVDYWERIR